MAGCVRRRTRGVGWADQVGPMTILDTAADMVGMQKSLPSTAEKPIALIIIIIITYKSARVIHFNQNLKHTLRRIAI